MARLGARFTAHMILKGPDSIAATNFTEMAKMFRRDTAMAIAKGPLGDALVVDAEERMQSALTEWQEGKKTAASSIGVRFNRSA